MPDKIVTKMAAIIIICILILKRHSSVLHVNSILCLKCLFLVVHIIVKSFDFNYDPTYKRIKLTTKLAAIIIIYKNIFFDENTIHMLNIYIFLKPP